MSRSYNYRAGSLPSGISLSIGRRVGMACDDQYIESWKCVHFPHCSPAPHTAVAAELYRRGWPGYRVRAWLAHQYGAWLRHEETDIRRGMNRQYRRRAAQAVRNAEYDEATDAPERPRRTSGWMTW